jgi:hypothetical protein
MYQLLVLAPFLWMLGTREQQLARASAGYRRRYGQKVEA